VTLHRRSQRHALAPPPDSLVAATGWCRWWWLGSATALTVYPDGAGVLIWTVGCYRTPPSLDSTTGSPARLSASLRSRRSCWNLRYAVIELQGSD
jgi:hypothetical protein